MPGCRPLRFVAALSLFGLIALTTACHTAPVLSDAAPMIESREHGQFVERSLLLDNGILHRYQVFIPSLKAGGAHPALILFLHGSGERGKDNRKQVEVGLAPVIRERMDEFPAIAVFPQMHIDQVDADRFTRTALSILDRSEDEFGADPKRILLTGVSAGGYASYDIAIMQPERFAAVVPICGGFDPPRVWDRERVDALGGLLTLDDAAAKMAHTRFWIFHGAQDTVVPPQKSREIFAALIRAKADVRYTEFPDANHNAWDPAYATAALWPWLFAQHR